MALATKYNPIEVEDKWYQFWMDRNYFHSEPDPSKEPYTIVIPPPNVTGVLHMGHMLNNTIQDVLIRKKRMEGYAACWVPGTDHASIATEAKVVAMLKDKGIDKNKISREDFLKYAWEWKEKYGGIILEQLKKLGASCDWQRTRFTMEEVLSEAVTDVFVDLYQKGYIYRGVRMVNWDPQGKTALSDDEVIYKELQSKLYYVDYRLEGVEGVLTIATTRPETILGDTAICINPNDERYKHLKGKRALVPLINRSIPIIEDEYVSMEFGTGCLKITPAHDPNDYEIGIKHNLPSIDTINDDGTMNEKAGLYIGEDRFVARKKIIRDIEAAGQMQKAEDYTHSVGFSERTDAVIEPKLSMQWFLKMDTITRPALENVMNNTIQFHPPKFKNMYRVWMENVRDWCISRQLWWGHRIPAYYLPNGEFVVAKNVEDAAEKARKRYPEENFTPDQLRQDEDVLDTWFSSWLWPITVFDGIKDPDNDDIKYYYPTNDLVTAPEIIFFWVARMIISGYEYRGDKPFKNVYFTGIVRDKVGRKMSKSLGNSPEPLELIRNYGADGVRTGMLFSSPAGNDLLFDIKLCEQGRNFANKIWNALRLVKGWETDTDLSGQDDLPAINWIENRFNQALTELEDQFNKYRISDALMIVYKLIWDDFCSWYLEMIKPAYQQPIASATLEATINIFEKLMKILHPFMPFITEEVYHLLKERKADDNIIISSWPKAENVDQELIRQAETAFQVIQNVRNIRNEKQISPKEPLELQIKSNNQVIFSKFMFVIKKLANLEEVQFVGEKTEGASGFIIGTNEFFIPVQGKINQEEELKKLNTELEYQLGFLKKTEAKLNNRKFVDNAPAQVVAMEQKKKSDAEIKIKSLEDSIKNLQGN
ncbi:MAG: valine--tRNA ligase [Candidatus Cyclobacteriaceae bacterium M3_2C_046]